MRSPTAENSHCCWFLVTLTLAAAVAVSAPSLCDRWRIAATVVELSFTCSHTLPPRTRSLPGDARVRAKLLTQFLAGSLTTDGSARDVRSPRTSPRRGGDVDLPLLLLRIASWVRVTGSTPASRYLACQFDALQHIVTTSASLAYSLLTVSVRSLATLPAAQTAVIWSYAVRVSTVTSRVCVAGPSPYQTGAVIDVVRAIDWSLSTEDVVAAALRLVATIAQCSPDAAMSLIRLQVVPTIVRVTADTRAGSTNVCTAVVSAFAAIAVSTYLHSQSCAMTTLDLDGWAAASTDAVTSRFGDRVSPPLQAALKPRTVSASRWWTCWQRQ